MKKFLKGFGVLAGFTTLAMVIATVFILWIKRWRAEHDGIVVSSTRG